MGLSRPSLSHSSPWGILGKSWGVCPAGSQGWASCLSRRKLRSPLERALSPSCPRGWRHATRAQVATEIPRKGSAAGVAQTTLHPVLGLCSEQGLLGESCSSVRPETCWWREGRTPKGHRPQEGSCGAEALPQSWPHRQGLAPVMSSSGSVSIPLPSEPSPPPYPPLFPPMPR